MSIKFIGFKTAHITFLKSDFIIHLAFQLSVNYC